MTYAALQARVLSFVNRPEIEQEVSACIGMAEAELQRAVRVRQMVGRATATLDNEYEILPADFAGVRSFELASSPTVELEYVKPERLAQYHSIYASAGQPIYYSVLGGEFRFAPPPSTTYPGSQLTYWRKIPALSEANTSNWLLEAHPDAYLYGALKHVAQMLGDSRGVAWAELLTAAVKAINAADPTESGEAQ